MQQDSLLIILIDKMFQKWENLKLSKVNSVYAYFGSSLIVTSSGVVPLEGGGDWIHHSGYIYSWRVYEESGLINLLYLPNWSVCLGFKINPSISNILIEAEVDLQTLEKHFNHNLKKNLFGRLELLKVVFKLKKEVQKVQVIEQKLTPPRKVCCANNDIDLSPLRNGFFIDNYKSRTYNGHINMNIRFGRKGNININKGWW